MKKWDYDRIGVFVEECGIRIETLLKAHQGHQCEAFPADLWAFSVDAVIRDLKTIKTLLKRERSSRA